MDETPKFGSNANIQPYGDILWHADAFPIICQGILFITETFAQTASENTSFWGKLLR